MVDSKESKSNILEILKNKGPCLPIQIARETKVDSLFVGAFLSELASEKEIKISNIKVGGSPLYFIQGQENKLDDFYEYLPGKEKETFLLLQKNKILEDKKQLPPIRVALRNLKDFALPFTNNNELFWRFHTITEQEIRKIFESAEKSEPIEKPKEEKPEKKIEEKPVSIIKKIAEKITGESKQKIKEKQAQIAPESKKEKIIKTNAKKQKEKSDFVLQVINFLQNQNTKILEEKDIKKKEFSAKVSINSELGKINFFCIAKDKKRLTENDLRIALQKSQALRMPALILFKDEINKKAKEYAEKWSSLLKLKKID